MSKKLYDILILIIWVVIFIIVGTLFVKLLPYLIIIAVATWSVKAIIRYIMDRKEKQDCAENKSDDFDVKDKKIIDVDYTEVDNEENK